MHTLNGPIQIKHHTMFVQRRSDAFARLQTTQNLDRIALQGADFDLAALMLRFTFPYLFFVSLTAFAGGVLNTYGRFSVPAFTPVLLNVVLIVADDREIGERHPGEFYGDEAFFLGKAHAAELIMAEDGEVMTIARDALVDGEIQPEEAHDFAVTIAREAKPAEEAS